MFKETMSQIRTATVLLILFTLLTGLIYPTILTVIAQLLFPKQANGSLIEQNGKMIGSELIGQSFTDPKYFWGRPSATTPFPYNGESSSASNLGPSNPNLLMIVKERVSYLHQAAQQNNTLVPVDLVTSSGSGLDPEISPLAAFYQVSRVAKARNVSEEELQKLIRNQIKNRTLLILGEPRVNVLELNMALDNQYPQDNVRSKNDKTTSKP